MVALGSLILFAADYPAVVGFYRQLGLELDGEQHGDDEPTHLACDVGGVHVAIFEGEGEGDARAPAYRGGGSCYIGFRVDRLLERVEALRASGHVIRQEPEAYPWGLRALIDDPDGRVVELFES